jgi:hypothetical protein
MVRLLKVVAPLVLERLSARVKRAVFLTGLDASISAIIATCLRSDAV